MFDIVEQYYSIYSIEIEDIESWISLKNLN